MCITSLMIDPDARFLLDDLLDRIVQLNSKQSDHIILSSPTKSIENLFSKPTQILNHSLRQLLEFEFETALQNGQLTSTSNIRHSRYYHPATAIKQTNDLRKRLLWIQQRQCIFKQLQINQEEQIENLNGINPSLESIWLQHRLQMLDCSIELLKQQNSIQQIQEESSSTCARCRIYQRKTNFDSNLIKQLKRQRQINIDHDYFITNSGSDFDLILSLSKIADRIGHITENVLTNSQNSIEPKKSINRTSNNGFLSLKKKSIQPKFQPSISMIVNNNNNNGDLNRNSKRTIDTNELSNKRQKRIASPLPVSPSIAPASPRDILTPSWRLLTNNDFDLTSLSSIPIDSIENEDISDDAYIRRHLRCELEQESWVIDHQHSSNRKTTQLQTSFSAPGGLSTTTQKQYRYRLGPNGIAYTETIDLK